MIPTKGGNIRESIPGVSRFQTDEPEGKSCEFAMLGMCGEQTGCVFGFVSSFCATFMYKYFHPSYGFILYYFLKFYQYFRIY